MADKLNRLQFKRLVKYSQQQRKPKLSIAVFTFQITFNTNLCYTLTNKQCLCIKLRNKNKPISSDNVSESMEFSD